MLHSVFSGECEYFLTLLWQACLIWSCDSFLRPASTNTVDRSFFSKKTTWPGSIKWLTRNNTMVLQSTHLWLFKVWMNTCYLTLLIDSLLVKNYKKKRKMLTKGTLTDVLRTLEKSFECIIFQPWIIKSFKIAGETSNLLPLLLLLLLFSCFLFCVCAEWRMFFNYNFTLQCSLKLPLLNSLKFQLYSYQCHVLGFTTFKVR